MTTLSDRDSNDLTRRELEKDEDARLAPWASRSSEARRAVPLDREGRLFDYRTEFQRDRDRIVHARAFRRLRLKSNGGALPPDEPFRDLLTHTLALSQMARTAARGLSLNEDLVEAIALGHSLGSPPFGMNGAAALDDMLRDAGGFRVPRQSLRVVDLLEKRYAHPGLNLTDAVREGIARLAGEDEVPPDLHPGAPPSCEARVVAALERPLTAIEELDDALRAREVDPSAVERLALVRVLRRHIGEGAFTGRGRGSGAGGLGMLHRLANTLHRGLTHMLVTGLIHASRRSLRLWGRTHGVDSPQAFRAAHDRVPPATIGLTPAAARMYDALGEFVGRRVHHAAGRAAVGLRARRVVQGLFRVMHDDPLVTDDYVLLRFKEQAGGPYLRDVPFSAVAGEIARRYRGNPLFSRLVADHIAGMTDPFALAEHERLVRA
jgi:dGTPase